MSLDLSETFVALTAAIDVVKGLPNIEVPKLRNEFPHRVRGGEINDFAGEPTELFSDKRIKDPEARKFDIDDTTAIITEFLTHNAKSHLESEKRKELVAEAAFESPLKHRAVLRHLGLQSVAGHKYLADELQRFKHAIGEIQCPRLGYASFIDEVLAVFESMFRITLSNALSLGCPSSMIAEWEGVVMNVVVDAIVLHWESVRAFCGEGDAVADIEESMCIMLEDCADRLSDISHSPLAWHARVRLEDTLGRNLV